MDDVPEPASAIGFDVMIERTEGRAVIAVSGDLDVASRPRFLAACRSGGVDDVIVDLGALEFMDCRGYSGLVEARLQCPSAAVRNAVGQPAHLIEMIRMMDLRMSAPTVSRCETGRPIVHDARGFSVHRLRRPTTRTTVSRITQTPTSNDSTAIGPRMVLTFRSARPSALRPLVTYRRSLPFRASQMLATPDSSYRVTIPLFRPEQVGVR